MGMKHIAALLGLAAISAPAAGHSIDKGTSVNISSVAPIPQHISKNFKRPRHQGYSRFLNQRQKRRDARRCNRKLK